jgi:ATP-dependent exoDNAse (exonuclease V) alpha subunit
MGAQATHALTQDQKNVLAWLEAGHNVFITGVAGVGKTMTLNSWIDSTSKSVGIAASTGIAATHIGGSTLHSWLGATPERDNMHRLCNATWMKKHGPRLKAVDALIIDEVSMVDAALFTLAEGAHRAARESVQPWGGMQVVLVGDLGQLPPVEAEAKGWCFQSPAWGESKIQVLELTQVMRQGDQRFADLLRRIRVGYVDDEVLRVLSSRRGAFDPDSPGTVRLVTHNAQCDEVNDQKLSQVPGKEHTFQAQDHGSEPHLSALKKSCLSPEVLKLKVGARVMFTKNDLDGAWVNGTMGEVLGFGANGDIDVRLNGGDIVSVQPVTWGKKHWEDEHTLRDVASRTQYPLRLAWAITIHKSQGMTIDRVSMDLSRVFSPGQAYVALSRCRTLEGVNIENWRGAESIIAHPMLRQAFARQA